VPCKAAAREVRVGNRLARFDLAVGCGEGDADLQLAAGARNCGSVNEIAAMFLSFCSCWG
jgi:hypothetical protein